MGPPQNLVEVQRQEARARQVVASDVLGDHIAQTHPLSLCAWLKVPPRWTEEGLVRALAQKHIAVTPSDPFMAGGSSEGGIRICLGGRLSHAALSDALHIVRRTFEQLPPIFDVSSIA